MREIYLSSSAIPAETAPDGWAYVYVAAKAGFGPIKIGVAINVRRRITDLENANGQRFPLVWMSGAYQNFREIEGSAHSCLRPARLIGEWFDVDFDFAIRVVQDIAAGRKRSRTALSGRAA